jgi:hypothetical protein
MLRFRGCTLQRDSMVTTRSGKNGPIIYTNIPGTPPRGTHRLLQPAVRMCVVSVAGSRLPQECGASGDDGRCEAPIGSPPHDESAHRGTHSLALSCPGGPTGRSERTRQNVVQRISSHLTTIIVCNNGTRRTLRCDPGKIVRGVTFPSEVHTLLGMSRNSHGPTRLWNFLSRSERMAADTRCVASRHPSPAPRFHHTSAYLPLSVGALGKK